MTVKSWIYCGHSKECRPCTDCICQDPGNMCEKSPREGDPKTYAAEPGSTVAASRNIVRGVVDQLLKSGELAPKPDPWEAELAAMQLCWEQLSKLDPRAQERVMSWLDDKLREVFG